MSRLIEHQYNIRKRSRITPAEFEHGMIVEANYNTKTGEARKYMLVVLSPDWPINSGMCHVIKMNDIPRHVFLRLITELGIVCVNNKRMVKIPMVDITETNTQRFYLDTIKSSRFPDVKKAYRTLLTDSFKNSSVIEYKFGKELENKYPCAAPEPIKVDSNED